jgi:hypothetical protein
VELSRHYAYYKYRERYGVWPNHPRIKNALLLEPTAETLRHIKHLQIKRARRKWAVEAVPPWEDRRA